MATADRLTLARLLSPAFPVGGFAYSQGLEQAIAVGAVTTGSMLADWISAVFRLGSGWCDAVFIAQARRSDDLDALDALAFAYAGSAERAAEMRDQGAALAAVLDRVGASPLPPRGYAVGFGAATRDLQIDSAEVVAHWLQALASQLVSVAVRLVPLGGAAGQAVLWKLAPIIIDVAKRAEGASLDDLGTAALGAELAAMAHETLEVRIFRS